MSNWREQAACLGMDSNLFFPESMQDETAWAARRVCRDCPVAEICLRDALVTEDRHGIRGGLSPTQRTALKKGRKPQRYRTPPGLSGPSNASKTHCKRNHEFTPENTYVHEGRRACKKCRSERGRAKKMVGAVAA